MVLSHYEPLQLLALDVMDNGFEPPTIIDLTVTANATVTSAAAGGGASAELFQRLLLSRNRWRRKLDGFRSSNVDRP